MRYEKLSSIRIIVLVFVFSWTPWFLLALLPLKNKGESHPLYLIGGVGPLIAVLICWLWDKRNRIKWENPFTKTKKLLWLLVLIVLYGALPVLIGAALAPLFGGPSFNLEAGKSSISALGGVFAFIPVVLLAGPITEEIAWHGYLWPRFRSLQSRIQASIILGLIWGLWHFPLFLITGTKQFSGGGILSLYFFFFILSGLFQTYLFASIYEITGFGVWSAIGMHFFVNLSGDFAAYSWQARTIEMCLLALCCVVSYIVLKKRESPPKTLPSTG